MRKRKEEENIMRGRDKEEKIMRRKEGEKVRFASIKEFF